MSLRCRDRMPLLLALPAMLALLLPSAAAHGGETERVLRVCADPDNLPYSHQDLNGFENRIAAIAADELHARLQYDWLPQRRGYVRKTMGAGLCDVFIGVPAGFERVLTTRPYYRSSYVFAWRRGDNAPRSFTDPQISRRKVGVQLVGNDLAATPPGYALARAGAVDNVIGYTVYGEGPAAQRMVAALAAGAIDTALLWGPQAGYFAQHAPRPIALAIAEAPAGLPTPFDFGIAMGVAHGNRVLRDELDGVLQRRRKDIDRVLAEYAVPRTDIDAEAP
jgi:mxaJ protein